MQAVADDKHKQADALRRLSARERQVLILVVEGRTSKEIARIVGVKPSSIDTYRSRIMAKLEIGDLASLVRFAIRHGLIKP
jgi:RNA polymerase sigma factor (sigma-70 family)